MNKRIAIIKDGPLLPVKDGASYKIYNYALEYQRNGFDVFMIIIDRGWVSDAAIKKSDLSKIILLPPEQVYNSDYITKLLRFLNIQIIQTNIPELLINKSTEWHHFYRIFDSHDVLFEQSEQKMCPSEQIGIEKFIDYLAGTFSDVVFCCTARDRRIYAQLGIPRTKLAIIKNGCKIPTFKYLRRSNDVVFLGHLFYEPNLLAAKDIYALARAAPTVRFDIVGAHPPGLKRNKPKNVHLLGFVQDISRVLRNTKIGICPLKQGSGSRVKILDYLANGLYVVSTPIGAAGLEDIKRHIVIEKKISSFVRHINRLLRKKEPNWHGRRMVIRKYDFTKLGRIASNIIKARFWRTKCVAPASGRRGG